jgi:predicted nucleic acid-binding protein
MKYTSPRVAVSDTGPLISALQSDCMNILLQLYDQIHIPVDEIHECRKHGADQIIRRLIDAGFIVVHQDFMPEENEAAKEIALEIAGYASTKDKDPEHHLPEAFAIVLMMRSSFQAIELLIDELAARNAARQRKVPVIGFPGILIRACCQRIIEPDDVKAALTECQKQGTHYSTKLINEIYGNLKASREAMK